MVFASNAGVAGALLDTGRVAQSAGGETGGAAIVTDSLARLPHLIWQMFEIESEHSGKHAKVPAPPAPEAGAAKAAISGDLFILGALSLPELDSADASGNTPLIWAADNNQAEAVASLLAKGAAVNARGYLGATALCRACRRGHELSIPIGRRACSVRSRWNQGGEN
jgi:ankyrin repeat protein